MYSPKESLDLGRVRTNHRYWAACTSCELIDADGILDVLHGQGPVAPYHPGVDQHCVKTSIITIRVDADTGS